MNEYLELLQSGGPKPTGSNEYLDAMRTERDWSEQALRSSLATGVDSKPDQIGQRNRVAGYLGTTPAAVEAVPDEAMRAARMRQVDEATADAPITRRAYTDADFAKLAHDDAQGLSMFERVARAILGPERKAPSVGPQTAAITSREFSKLVQDTMARNPALDADAARAMLSQRYTVDNSPGGVRGWSSPPTTLSSLVAGVRSALSEGLFEQTRQGVRRFAGDMLGLDTVAADAQRMNRQSLNRQFLDTPNPEGLPGDIYRGVISTAQSTPAIVAGFYSSPAALASFFAQTAAPAYSKYRDRGGSKGEAALGAGLEGLAEVLGEKIPLDYMVQRFGRAGMSEFVAGMLAREIPSEIATTIAQSATDTAIANPGKTWGDFARELPEEIRQTVIGTIVQSGIFGGAGALARRMELRAQRAAEAEARADLFGKLNELAAASKVLERDPTSFERFAEQIQEAGPVKDLYIDANVLMQSGAAEALAQVSPSVAQQLPLAVASGGTVRIPFAEYSARVAPTDIGPALLDDLKDSPNGFSRREAQEYMQSGAAEELKSEVDRIVNEQNKDDGFRAQVDEVKAAVRAELDATKRFRPEVNDAYASLTARFFAVMGARMGVAPGELYRRFQLRVQTRMNEGAGVLNQFERTRSETWDDGTVIDFGKSPFPQLPGKVDMPTGRDIPVETTIALSDLHSTQREITRQGLEKPRDDSHGLPFVVHSNGILYIQDGHHRLASQRFKGDVSAKVRLVDLDAKAGKSPYVQKSLNQPAYHGSPHIFDRFDLSKIGTGEGAQAYGWGLYFAENKGIAEEYRKRLARGTAPPSAFITVDGEKLTDLMDADPTLRGVARAKVSSSLNLTFDVDKALETLRYQEEQAAATITPAGRENMAAARAFVESLRGKKLEKSEPPKGALYQVDIPDEAVARMLDWDKPLSEQAPEVREALESSGSLVVSEDLGSRAANEVRKLAAAVGLADWAKRDLEQIAKGLEKSKSPKHVAGVLKGMQLDFGINPDNGPFAPLARGFLDFVKTTQYVPDMDRGSGFYSLLSAMRGSDKAASEYLNSIGIPGIKYFDGGSRAAGEGTRNLVVFDDSLIKITHKDGTPVTQAERDEFLQNTGAPRAAFNPSTNTITLTAQSDLSSFLHESGHYFLETLVTLAGEMEGRSDLTPGEREVLADVNALMKWFGVPDLATWTGLDFEEKRAYHEQFARGFEAYLFEGKSPAVELHGLFQRFRAWLLSIYRELRNLNVELDDTVRGVMDRMLATTEEIKLAEQGRSMMPLFENADQTKMDPEEWAAYQSAHTDATNDATEDLQAKGLRDMQWLNNKRSREIARLKRLSAERRREVRMEVRTEVMSEPVYRAWDFLTQKDGPRLSRAALNESGIPDQILAHVRNLRMTADEGFTPDEIAEKFGFPSGDDLVRTLAAAQKPRDEIEQRTDAAMLERYGELIDQQSIEREADKAIYSEARAKFVTTEHNALAKATGKPRILESAAREFARLSVAQQKVKDLRPGQWAAAAARASKATEKAVRADKLEVAAAESRNRVLSTYLTKATYEAQDEVETIRQFFRRVVTTPDDRVGKTRDMDMVNAARAILANFGYGTKAKTAGEYLKRVQENDPGLYEVLSASVDAARDLGVTNIQDLTVEQLRGLYEEVRSMWHLARRSRQMEIDGDKLDREDVAQQLADRMREIGIPEESPGEKSAITPEEQRGLTISGVKAMLRRVESWVDLMDGENKMGAFRRFVFLPVKEAADAYRLDKIAYLKEFRSLFDAIAPTMKRATIESKELNYTFGKDQGGVAMNEIVHAILHTGNDSNKRKLLLGRGWATETETGELDTSRWDAFLARLRDEGQLTQAHFDFAQRVWDLLEKTKPLAQKAHRDAYGKYFSEVTANEFVDPFGIVRRGGYVPAQTDPRIVKDNELRRLIEEGKESMVFAFPSTNKGFTYGRVEYNRPLLLDLRTLPQHIDRVLLFSRMEMPTRDVAKLIRMNVVSVPLNKLNPGAIPGMLTPWLTRSARQQVVTPIPGDAGLSRLLNTIRIRTSMATMFANVSNAAQQITGFSLAAVKVPPKYLLSAAADYLKAPRDMSATVADLSPYMAHRMSNEVSVMMGEIDKILLDPNILQRAEEWTRRHTFFMQSAVDNVMGPIIWTGAYNQAIEEKYDARDAARIADSAVRQTQGSTLPEDVSRAETGNAFFRLFTQFAGFFNTQANLLGTEFGKVTRDMGLRKGFGRGLYVLTFGLLVSAWVAEAIALAFRGGPDDEDKDGEYLDDWIMSVIVFGTMRNVTAFAPGVGQIANSAIARFNKNPVDDKMSVAPAVGALEAVAGVPVDLYKAAIEEGNARRTVRDVATLISITTGLPASVAARPLGYAAAIAQGKVDPTGPIDAARGFVTGTPSPDSRQ